MSALEVATTEGILYVCDVSGMVGITDQSRKLGPDAALMDPDQAHELAILLDSALIENTPLGVLGSVETTNGRKFVRHFGYHVAISDGPERHSGWTLRLRDQVEALRDAIDRAARDSIAA